MSENRHTSIGIHGLQPHGAPMAIRRLALMRRAGWVAVVLFCLLLVGAAVVVGLRVVRAHALAGAAREQSVIFVNVITPKAANAERQLTLPGTLQGFIEAPIFARTSGYVQRWYKDIGEPVKQGELLAQIAAPEVAQQLAEARAAQDQANTNAQLAKSSLVRWESLRQRDAVSQQELDERRNAAAVASATQAATAASVRRLQELVGYSRITAPFSGVITRRNIDIGTLIDAGSAAKLLFTLAKIDPLRVYVYVPQSYATQVQIGAKAEVRFKESPGQVFSGSVARTAGAIDPATRTMQTEISLPNADGKLLPGAFVEVSIKSVAAAASIVTVPGNTLLFGANGPQVAVVDAAQKVRLQPVTIARELGAEVELSSGVGIQDRLIINPSDSLSTGDTVNLGAAVKTSIR